MPSHGEDLARRLAASHTSPAVAYFLAKLPQSTLQSTTLGQLLVHLAGEMGISKFDSDFVSQVKAYAQSAPPPPDGFYEYAHRKKEALEKFQKTLKRKREEAKDDYHAYLGAFMPFVVQFLKPRPEKGEDRAPHSGSLFFVFSTYELGVKTCLDILRRGFQQTVNFQTVTTVFTQLYEIRVPNSMLADRNNDRLAYMILDWEVEEHKLRGEDGSPRLSRYDVDQLRLAFPLWFYRKLVEVKAVGPSEVVSSKCLFFSIL